ncbi:hypothetical protein [Spirosoma validum]|uniref:AlgX/AlgJ SGNH hydrolase-like domain-containing protein n=1 Tax=Spirosoma validum TaxID=2771355 RepID=A0A927GG87_9BACT|nr:hypothetical protein [Spirosoma validum]MBD2756624.1 hypothetical protein [Spirosoma validum]
MRLLRYIILAIVLILWGAGLSTTVSRYLYKLNVIVDEYRYGDLYRLSSLPQFKLWPADCPSTDQSSDTASTHFYIIGDSFTEPQRLNKSDFRVRHFQRVHWGSNQFIQLDPAKRNVLLIESVERHVREHFAQPVREFTIEVDTNRITKYPPTLSQHIMADFRLGTSAVEERLESTLFSHDWAFWFKEVKAKITLDWFGRVSPSVSLSKDKKHIFLNLDTDTTKAKVLNSSFSPLTNREVNVLIDSINATAGRYRKLGFDEVYLSLIPNKASILEPNRGAYNHLIERIQSNPNLHVPIIDTYTPFRNKPTAVYLKSDTHWTCEGRSIWLDLVREKLHI